jgi:hypothetical protein
MYGHKTSLKLVAAVMAVACGAARADMGSVWVEGVAKSAITINWAEPTLGHRFATKAPDYTITAEAVSSYPYSEPLTEAHKLSYRLSGEESRPHTIVGLHANTNYRITVEAYAEKKTIFGQWINAKDRLLGVVRQKTSAAEPQPNLRVSATTPSAITVELSIPKPELFDKIRVAYKQKGSSVQLSATAQDALLPAQEWTESNATRGWQDALSVSTSMPAVFKSLAPATSYEVVAYGFNIGISQGVKLASAMARTGGYSPIRQTATCVEMDHVSLLDTYGKTISARYQGGRVLDLAAQCNPDLFTTQQEILSDEGDDLSSNLTALRYLIVNQTETFECWQASEAQSGGLTLEVFLATLPQELFAKVDGEIDPEAPLFQRGDSDRNGILDISDAIVVLGFLFHGGAQIHCRDAADSNDDGFIDLSDAVSVLTFLFSTGRAPAYPFQVCGADPTQDDLTCEEYNGCPR